MENSRVQKENSNCQRENLIMSCTLICKRKKKYFQSRKRVKISHAKNLKCKDFLSFLTDLSLI